MLPLSSRLLATGRKHCPGCVRKFPSKPARIQCRRHGSARERVRPARLARPPCQHRCHYRCRAPRASRQVPPSAWPASPRRPSTARGAGRRPARERRRCRCRCRRRRPPGPVTGRQSCHMLGADPCVRVMQGIAQGCRASTLPLPAPSQPTPASTQVFGRAMGL